MEKGVNCQVELVRREGTFRLAWRCFLEVGGCWHLERLRLLGLDLEAPDTNTTRGYLSNNVIF